MFLLEIIYQILKEFFLLTIDVLPYFVLGAIFSAFFERYFHPDLALKYLSGGISSIVNVSLLGAILPGCACATVPMAEGLKRKGAKLGTISAFVMVSPLLSPHTVALTYGMLGWKFTMARIVFSISGAIILGFLFSYFQKIGIRGFIVTGELEIKYDHCDGVERVSCNIQEQKVSFLKSFISMLKDLGKYFLLGMFIASLLSVFIPEEAIPKYIGSSGIFAYLVSALLGIPIYVCEGEEIPITSTLLKLGLGRGPSFTFLLGSVGTCIPTMLMVQKIIGKRPVLFYIFGWIVFVIGSGLLFGLFSK